MLILISSNSLLIFVLLKFSPWVNMNFQQLPSELNKIINDLVKSDGGCGTEAEALRLESLTKLFFENRNGDVSIEIAIYYECSSYQHLRIPLHGEQ